MTIYIDDGETVKIYPVKIKVAKAVMTLLELDDKLVRQKVRNNTKMETLVMFHTTIITEMGLKYLERSNKNGNRKNVSYVWNN